MKTLIAFILRHYFFFLFLILEICAFYIIINRSYYQRAVIINSANTISGNILSHWSNINEYFSLKQSNISLAEENARLKNYIDSHNVLLSYSRDTITTKRNRLPAKIISNTVNKRNNYLIINKGKADGVHRDMAVLSTSGIVGIVKETGKNYSSVLSVLHMQSKISVRIKKNNYLGTLIWDGKDYRIGSVIDVPAHVNIQKGDTIVSSGFSHIFPDGINIGIIDSFRVKEDDNFYLINIRFLTDYNSLVWVEVIDNKDRNEILKLKEPEEEE